MPQRKTYRWIYNLLTALVLIWAATASAIDWENETQLCRYVIQRDGTETNKAFRARHYAPDRQIDINHLKIDITPDFEASTVAGKVTLRFVPIGKPLKKLLLDAIDLTVLDVEASVVLAGYTTTDEKITVTFAEPVSTGNTIEVTVTYEAEPKEGLYFRTPAKGYKKEDIHIYTQGEDHLHPHWFPSFDYPNERFTSEMICHVPPDFSVLSNGRLISEKVDAGTGLKSVVWLQEKPHVNYLIALVAGRLKKIEDRYRDVPLSFWTPASQIGDAENTFEETADMMAFFEDEIGVAYPWAEYKQAIVKDFGGGMENTTLTIMTDGTLFADETENIRSSRSLVAHELVHQWFGDDLTCKDWSHLWLNEGFATYYAHLYEGHRTKGKGLLYGLYRNSRNILNKKDSLPIVYREYSHPWDQFNYRAYSKGSWVLHMLRTQLGNDLFRQVIKTYVQRHALTSVVTEDLNRVVEELSGRSYDQFFDQWVYHGRQPTLTVSYSWDEKSKLAKVSVAQKQALNHNVRLFSFPTKIRFRMASGTVEHNIEITEQEQDFYFPLQDEPELVRFDPEFGVLAKVQFNKPKGMLYRQLKDEDDVVGRLLAAEALQKKSDKKTTEALKKALNEDPFYGVRVEASKALREIHTPEAFEALAASLDQEDARVRRRVVMDIGGFFREESKAHSKRVLQTEKNPAILAQALRNLGRYAGNDTRKMLNNFLKSSSYRNELADAAIQAIRTQDDPSYIKPLIKTLASHESAFTSRGFGRGLRALAYIGRNEDDKDEVRNFLTGFVNHKKERIQADAIRALGDLRDPQAISVVATFTSAREQKDNIHKAAEGALKNLRDVQKVPVELRSLRNEVIDLKKESEKLREELEDLKKRFEAKE